MKNLLSLLLVLALVLLALPSAAQTGFIASTQAARCSAVSVRTSEPLSMIACLFCWLTLVDSAFRASETSDRIVPS